MSRGRPPVRGFEIALPVARERGQLVMRFIQEDECPADFVFVSNGKDIFTRLRRAIPFRLTLEEIEAEFRKPLRQLRNIPGYAEFWIYSKKGSLRFFRVEADGLVELGRDGLPLPPGGKIPRRRKAAAGGTTALPAQTSPATPSPTETSMTLGMVETGPAEGPV